jgi:hypothetical protein
LTAFGAKNLKNAKLRFQAMLWSPSMPAMLIHPFSPQHMHASNSQTMFLTSTHDQRDIPIPLPLLPLLLSSGFQTLQFLFFIGLQKRTFAAQLLTSHQFLSRLLPAFPGVSVPLLHFKHSELP